MKKPTSAQDYALLLAYLFAPDTDRDSPQRKAAAMLRRAREEAKNQHEAARTDLANHVRSVTEPEITPANRDLRPLSHTGEDPSFARKYGLLLMITSGVVAFVLFLVVIVRTRRLVSKLLVDKGKRQQGQE